MDRQQAIKERTLEEALFITKNKATIRQTAANSDVSKSTTHTDLTVRLPNYSPLLAKKVRKILNKKLFRKAYKRWNGYKEKICCQINICCGVKKCYLRFYRILGNIFNFNSFELFLLCLLGFQCCVFSCSFLLLLLLLLICQVL